MIGILVSLALAAPVQEYQSCINRHIVEAKHIEPTRIGIHMFVASADFHCVKEQGSGTDQYVYEKNRIMKEARVRLRKEAMID